MVTGVQTVLFRSRHGDDIACVILEAVAGNMNLIPADADFISTIRSLTQEYGSLFIVDEVMSGFRAHYQGAVGLYQTEPDLVCLGKVIGGGFPVAALVIADQQCCGEYVPGPCTHRPSSHESW